MSETMPFDDLVKTLKAPAQRDVVITNTLGYIARRYPAFIGLAIKRSGIDVLDYMARLDEDVRVPILEAAFTVCYSSGIDLLQHRSGLLDAITICRRVLDLGGTLTDATSELTTLSDTLRAEETQYIERRQLFVDAITKYGANTTGE